MIRQLSLIVALLAAQAGLAPSRPATGVGRFPHLEVDVRNRELRVECEALAVEAPLEFLLVLNGTSEHETVLRSAVRPSHVHAGLLMLGMKPGSPARYSEEEKRWVPPSGDALKVEVEFVGEDGKTRRLPAARLMREIRTKRPMPETHWLFCGSRVMEDGQYAADITGYLVSIVNFDLTLIDLPGLHSNADETLEWERNPEVTPKRGTKVTLVISPARGAGAATTQPATTTSRPAPADGGP